MSTNTHIGRPKRYETPAEKQKAYRERKKMAEMPEAVLRNKIDHLKAALLEASSACDRHRATLAPLDDNAYRQWLAEHARLNDVWWKAHCAHYHAKLELDAFLYEGSARDWFNYMSRCNV